MPALTAADLDPESLANARRMAASAVAVFPDSGPIHFRDARHRFVLDPDGSVTSVELVDDDPPPDSPRTEIAGLELGPAVVVLPAVALRVGGWGFLAWVLRLHRLPPGPIELRAVPDLAEDPTAVAVVWRSLLPCGARHPSNGRPCIRPGRCRAHEYYRAEEPRTSPTYRATDVWTWASTGTP